MPEQDVFLGPFAYHPNQHHFAEPGVAVLLEELTPKPVAHLLAAEAHWAVV